MGHDLLSRVSSVSYDWASACLVAKKTNGVTMIQKMMGYALGVFLLLAAFPAQARVVSRQVKGLRLSFVQDIDIKGSPFKGPADAPVVITIFSDYQ